MPTGRPGNMDAAHELAASSGSFRAATASITSADIAELLDDDPVSLRLPRGHGVAPFQRRSTDVVPTFWRTPAAVADALAGSRDGGNAEANDASDVAARRQRSASQARKLQGHRQVSFLDVTSLASALKGAAEASPIASESRLSQHSSPASSAGESEGREASSRLLESGHVALWMAVSKQAAPLALSGPRLEASVEAVPSSCKLPLAVVASVQHMRFGVQRKLLTSVLCLPESGAHAKHRQLLHLPPSGASVAAMRAFPGGPGDLAAQLVILTGDVSVKPVRAPSH